MPEQFANNFSTKLAAGINPVQVNMNITPGDGAVLQSKLPNTISATDPVRLTLVRKSGGVETAWEVVEVTGRSTDTLTITRGLSNEGTTAIEWFTGEDIEARFTRGLAEGLRATAGIITKSFTTPQLSLSSQTILPPISHGLGEVPKFIQEFLINVTPEFGYSSGEIIYLAGGNGYGTAGGYANATVTINASNIVISMGQAPGGTAPAFAVQRRDSGLFLMAPINNSNWRYYVTVFA